MIPYHSLVVIIRPTLKVEYSYKEERKRWGNWAFLASFMAGMVWH